MRDSQKSKVYRAEDGRIYSENLSWEDAEAFVQKVQTSKYVVRKYGRKRIDLMRFKGRGGLATWSNNRRVIKLRNYTSRQYILHEMAHHYRGSGCGHDWLYCQIYLDLVRHFHGRELHDWLKASFKEHGVRYRKPYKRNITPEQREILRERVALAREARKKKVAV